MATDDKGNYGTPISYATQQEDNEITFTDPFGFVLSVKGIQSNKIIFFELDILFVWKFYLSIKNCYIFHAAGEKVVTDITGNDGSWTFMCASWTSNLGQWKIYKNGLVADEGFNLARGKVIKGNSMNRKWFKDSRQY